MRCSPALLLLLLLRATFGCGMGSQSAVAAAEHARPHVAQFERFELWVVRAADGSMVRRNEAALNETVFAPVRRTDGVLGAWVHLSGRPPLDLALAGSGPEPELRSAQRVRGPELGESEPRPERGELLALVRDPCELPPRAAASALAGAASCVVLARESQSSAGPLRVVAAFADRTSEPGQGTGTTARAIE